MADVTRRALVTTIYHDETGGIARIERLVAHQYKNPKNDELNIEQNARIPIEPADMTAGDKSAGRAWLNRCGDMTERVRPLVKPQD